MVKPVKLSVTPEQLKVVKSTSFWEGVMAAVLVVGGIFVFGLVIYKVHDHNKYLQEEHERVVRLQDQVRSLQYLEERNLDRWWKLHEKVEKMGGDK